MSDKILSEMDKKLWLDWWARGDDPRPSLVQEQQLTAPSRRIDLHGMTVSEAYSRTMQFIEDHHRAGTKDVVVVTGKSGQIREEFTGWMVKMIKVSRYAPLVDKRGGIGSYRLYLSYQRSSKAT